MFNSGCELSLGHHSCSPAPRRFVERTRATRKQHENVQRKNGHGEEKGARSMSGGSQWSC